MTQRRDPFLDLKKQAQTSASGGDIRMQAPSVLDQIPIVAPRQRNRCFERNNRAWSYKVPRHLWQKAIGIRDAITGIAQSGSTSTDQIACAFISLALLHIEHGIMRIHSHPDPLRQKMAVTWQDAETGWPQEIPNKKFKPKRNMKERQALYLGYRWSKTVHKQIRALAGDTLAVGEVVVVLLDHSLGAYKQGKLRLSFQPASTHQNVKGEWL